MIKKRKDNRGLVIPKIFIYLIKLLEKISPVLCMHFARLIWSKPIKYKIPEREKSILFKSEISDLKIQSINKVIKYYHWNGNGPKVLLVHGWSGRATNLYKIINHLYKKGFDIHAFDAPAHGMSSSLTTNLPEFVSCIEEISKKIDPLSYLIGHSGGGFASIYAASKNLKIKKLILISPFDSVLDLFQTYFKMINVGEKVGDLMLNYFNEKKGIIVDENMCSSIFAKSVNCNTLLIHDKNDKEVSIDDSKKIEKNLSKVLKLYTKGLGHRRILRDEKVVRKIDLFLNSK